MPKTTLQVSTDVAADPASVWTRFTVPGHIMQWNFASEEWHCPAAENDLRPGGVYRTRMEARDGSQGFDFEGVYDEVVPESRLAYTLTNGRQVKTEFSDQNGRTRVTTTFEPEDSFPIEVQQAGWQAIIDNFRRYVESEPERMVREQVTIDTPADTVWSIITHPRYARELGQQFDKNAYVRSDWQLGSAVEFVYEPERIAATGTISELKPLELIRIDFDFDGFAYYESFHFSSTEGQTILTAEAGPYTHARDEHATVWSNWLQKVRELSEQQ